MTASRATRCSSLDWFSRASLFPGSSATCHSSMRPTAVTISKPFAAPAWIDSHLVSGNPHLGILALTGLAEPPALIRAQFILATSDASRLRCHIRDFDPPSRSRLFKHQHLVVGPQMLAEPGKESLPFGKGFVQSFAR